MSKSSYSMLSLSNLWHKLCKLLEVTETQGQEQWPKTWTDIVVCSFRSALNPRIFRFTSWNSLWIFSGLHSDVRENPGNDYERLVTAASNEDLSLCACERWRSFGRRMCVQQLFLLVRFAGTSWNRKTLWPPLSSSFFFFIQLRHSATWTLTLTWSNISFIDQKN